MVGASFVTLVVIGTIILATAIAVVVWRIRSEWADSIQVFPSATSSLPNAVSASEVVHDPTGTAFDPIIAPRKSPENSILSNLLKDFLPDVTAFVSLAQIAAELKTPDGQPLPQEEAAPAMYAALSKLMESQPENSALRAMYSVLGEKLKEAEETSGTNRLKVVKQGDSMKIEFDGIVYPKPEDIPDPAFRDRACQLEEVLQSSKLEEILRSAGRGII